MVSIGQQMWYTLGCGVHTLRPDRKRHGSLPQGHPKNRIEVFQILEGATHEGQLCAIEDFGKTTACKEQLSVLGGNALHILMWSSPGEWAIRKLSVSKIFHRGSCFTSKNRIDSPYRPPLNSRTLGWLMAFGGGAINIPTLNFVSSFVVTHSHTSKGSVTLPQSNVMIDTLFNSLRASKRSGMMHTGKISGPLPLPFQSSTTNSLTYDPFSRRWRSLAFTASKSHSPIVLELHKGVRYFPWNRPARMHRRYFSNIT